MIENNVIYYSIVHKKKIKINETSNKLETNQSRYLLKKMLEYFDLDMPEISLSKNGKPFFKNSKIFFNYSHSKNYVSCAISLSEVGIDIEEINSNISDKVAKKYLDDEKNPSKRLQMWVKKESYSKLKGLGFQIDFKNIDLNNIKEKNCFIKSNDYICSIFSNNKDCIFKELNINDKLW